MEFNQELKNWIDTPEEQRDWARGAELLYRLNGNPIMYRNLMVNPKKKSDIITYHLEKAYKTRINAATHAEVEQMQKQVATIQKKHHFNKSQDGNQFRKGKRIDHDQLPERIQKLYLDNLEILYRMREVHTRMLLMTEQIENKTCPDSDIYPYLKEIIALDKKYRNNWKQYDIYEIGGKSNIDRSDDQQAESYKSIRLINLNKKRYEKTPTDELKNKMLQWYSRVLDPSEKLTDELKRLGIL